MMTTIDFLVRIEEDGLRLSEKLGRETTNAEQKELFILLADSQKRRLGTLATLKKHISSREADEMTVPETTYLHNGFRTLMRNGNINKMLKNDQDAFGHIVTTEEEVIHVLEGLAADEPRKEVCWMLRRIVNEEKEHLNNIESIYDFIETPHTYLEWGEFSNLHPL